LLLAVISNKNALYRQIIELLTWFKFRINVTQFEKLNFTLLQVQDFTPDAKN